METYASMLAWRIPWTEEPGGLHSMRLQRVRHDLVTDQPTNKRSEMLIFKKMTPVFYFRVGNFLNKPCCDLQMLK